MFRQGPGFQAVETLGNKQFHLLQGGARPTGILFGESLFELLAGILPHQLSFEFVFGEFPILDSSHRLVELGTHVGDFLQGHAGQFLANGKQSIILTALIVNRAHCIQLVLEKKRLGSRFAHLFCVSGKHLRGEFSKKGIESLVGSQGIFGK